MDCVDLAFFIQRWIFNRNFEIEKREKGSIFYFASFLRKHLTEYLSEKTEDHQDGDCVLMKHRGRLCHVGILHIHKGKKYIVHTMDSFKTSVEHQFERIKIYGLEVEGVYKWK